MTTTAQHSAAFEFDPATQEDAIRHFEGDLRLEVRGAYVKSTSQTFSCASSAENYTARSGHKASISIKKGA
jgi:hypothetical protein